MIGVINPGEFDGSNAFEVFVSHDTSDFVCCGGFTILGEGATSLDGVFATSVLGFGADFNSATTNDGISIVTNGVTFDLHDYYPDSPMSDGDGFLGIVDAAGITGFSIVPDDQSVSDLAEIAELDNFRFAHEGMTGPGPGPGPGSPVPEPSAALLFGIGAVCIGVTGRHAR
jgi:hypothetical protein